MPYSDAHLHLERMEQQALDGLLSRASDAGMEMMVTVGMLPESSAEAVALAEAHPELYAAVGVHPWNAVAMDEGLYQRLEALARSPRVVFISEIGLDFVRNPEHELQKAMLSAHLRLANELELPVNLHCREAHEEMMRLLEEADLKAGGMIHGFSGDKEMLLDWLNLGFYVSLGARMVLAGDEGFLAMARQVPLERLILETDFVGASADPHTAGRPEPADAVPAAAAKLGQLYGISGEEVGSRATENLRRLARLAA